MHRIVIVLAAAAALCAATLDAHEESAALRDEISQLRLELASLQSSAERVPTVFSRSSIQAAKFSHTYAVSSRAFVFCSRASKWFSAPISETPSGSAQTCSIYPSMSLPSTSSRDRRTSN